MYNNGESSSDKFLVYRKYHVSINGNALNKTAQINQCFLIDIIYECIVNHRGHAEDNISEDYLYLLIAYYNDYYVHSSLGKAYSKEKVFLQAFVPTGEQIRFQRESLCSENYSRENYIIELMQKDGFQFDKSLDIEKLYNSCFKCNKKEFETIILFLLVLPIIKATTYSKKQIVDLIVNCKISCNLKAIESILNAYSADINEIRCSKLKRQLFYLKPIIRNGESYTFVNPYLMWFLFENCNYWILRNYYYNKDSQVFTNSFGAYFENYVEEILNYCLPHDSFERIPIDKKEKRADWSISAGSIDIIVEQKSCLAEIGIKQQIIDLDKVEKHIAKVFGEAILQLQSTERAFNKDKAIKIVLMYEDYFNNACLKDTFRLNPDLIDDGEYWLLSIREFEMLMICYKKNPDLFNTIINEKYKTHPISYAESVEDVMKKHKIIRNDYIYDRNIIKKYNDSLNQILRKLNSVINN